MNEAKNNLRGVPAHASITTNCQSGDAFTTDPSTVDFGALPLSLAYWLDVDADLSPISDFTLRKNLGYLDELPPFATSSKGERVALHTLFPHSLSLGRLVPGIDAYTIMSTSDLRGENCYNPVRLSIFTVAHDSGEERHLLVVADVRREREFLLRRLDLLAGRAGAVWHHTANQATAGLGFLGFVENCLIDVLAGEREINADCLQGVKGGARALKWAQENIRVVCALARSNDGAKEVGLVESLEILSRFCRGMYAPDMRIEVTQLDERAEGIAEGGKFAISRRQPGQILLPETPLFHLIFELMHVVYRLGGRDITWNVLTNREVTMEVGFDIAWSTEIGFLIAMSVGRASGIGVEALGKRLVRIVVW